MPLNLADINTDYIIQKICGNENERHHLETLGFLEGATIRILSILFGSYIVPKRNILIFYFFGSDFLCPRFRLYLHPGSVCDTM